MFINFQLIVKSLFFVLTGIPYTLGISVLSFLTGCLLGIIISFLRMSKNSWFRSFARIYISIMRGVPMLVVLFVLYFGLPYFEVQLPALLCAYIGFSTVSAAYIAEIFRSSISAVDKGQWEAARSLGLPAKSILKSIILPQAFRIAIPPLGNVMLDMLKSSSLAAMITVPDIFQNAKIIGGREYDYMSMYILIAFIYWLLCFLFEIFQNHLEAKLSVY
ncbi:amino acid ABC transporter permease [Streptococcus ratti]|uniref:Amino acid ABC transporter, permease protein n=1 Tax=Streptococcus ratti FA-1 = DSM 20564 TaxID=699248 RepID=A0ABN0GUM0_STRRT|nr:amino acid ABC transporter permease [Streptococcus ratti]EJN94036.1 putative amino acid ABC transporter, permease protein [Streptococcus ratti FA-1 = DSM 20564]QEY07869.1 amino acid ABC transporter permease [Streptococcus ratti]VEI60338.1 amino acid ABC transporter permease [Streptococcus mutans]